MLIEHNIMTSFCFTLYSVSDIISSLIQHTSLKVIRTVYITLEKTHHVINSKNKNHSTTVLPKSRFVEA